jgi:hypothetical protein
LPSNAGFALQVMPDKREARILSRIAASEKSREPAGFKLETDEKVLARITEGIYRQPASALRELVSNAHDADAAEVVILTDAPRFSEITVRDDGCGMSAEVLVHLGLHIGGSAKRTAKGRELGITDSERLDRSPGGRKLIGKLGIGLFSVAQFTNHFLVITKQAGDDFRTVADFTLRKTEGTQETLDFEGGEDRLYEAGHVSIWREPAADRKSHGTEVKLLDLLPRTRAELASDDLWAKHDFQSEDPEAPKLSEPRLHIGRMQAGAGGLLAKQPALPWEDSDKPKERFGKIITMLRALITTDRDSGVDLQAVCDRYFQTLWTIALSAPLAYFEGHPFDIEGCGEVMFFELENKLKGQASPLDLTEGQTPRSALSLTAPDGPTAGTFEVFMDGVQLFRPILFHNLPKTQSALKNPLLFVGRHTEDFGGRSAQLTGGPLAFEAYLFWSPKIIPKQHQGVVLRVGNASGALFDETFMGYETSELTRKEQVTAEIFVHQGLDAAINIDRESFNFAHLHYQFLMRWLHSAFRQFSNRHKELGKQRRTVRKKFESVQAQERVAEKVENALRSRGIEDVPAVVLLEPERLSEAGQLRADGIIALRKSAVVPPSGQQRRSPDEALRRELAEKKAVAIAQLLHGMGLLESLSYEEQEQLIRDILEIVLLDN